MSTCDILIVGGGILGLASAYRLTQRYPERRLIVVEKENRLAAHQSGRNSGVIHSGVYYRPGSLKAQNCRAGKAALEAFCRQHDINYRHCGKLIVAVQESELPGLHELRARGQANGVACRIIGPDALLEIEPHAVGLQALHVPEAGIVDYREVCDCLARLLRQQGHRIELDTTVTGIRENEREVVVNTTRGVFITQFLVNCAGLYSDRLVRLAGGEAPAQIVPFRGEYYELVPAARRLCRGLIYPVPDPRFPFLGVHFTALIDGGVECGPNAVLAFGREAYHLTTIKAAELWETLAYQGFRQLARRYWRTGLGELGRSLSKRAFVRALQQLIPAVRVGDLVPAPAGIRAQAVDPTGELLDDFAFHETARAVHVVNAPSPGATACLSIGAQVADRLAERLATR